MITASEYNDAIDKVFDIVNLIADQEIVFRRQIAWNNDLLGQILNHDLDDLLRGLNRWRIKS